MEEAQALLIEHLQEKIKSLEAEVYDLQEQVSDLEDERDELDSKVEDLEDKGLSPVEQLVMDMVHNYYYHYHKDYTSVEQIMEKLDFVLRYN